MAGYLAVYLRLSQEDVDVKDNVLKDESNSIHSQRLLVKRYVEEHTDLAALPILEFRDDGYTGTNFDRPQFQKMISMVRAGEMDCVIVKDLSRFGRNYLEVGDYLEHIFPFLGVRFVAVNDHYDSNDYLGTTGGIDVAFRNLVYQRYSQDLSEKVKSAMHMKMEKGKYVTHCPYGYQKKPGVKHRMIPDPVTAPIVRDIFLAAIEGRRTTEIAVMLNERRIPTPMEYKKLSCKTIQNDAMWSHQAVLRILKNYKYTGAMVNFKCENETIRARTQRQRKPEEWVVAENSHEAIVSHEEYAQANASIRKVRGSNRVQGDRRDRVYYCAYCGRRLRKTFGADEYYSCATQLYRKDVECTKVRWSRSEIEEVVLSAYKAQLALMYEEHKKTADKISEDPLKSCREKQNRVSEQIAACAGQNLWLYECFKDGGFDRDEFMIKKSELIEQKTVLEDQLVQLRKEEEEITLLHAEQAEHRQNISSSEELLQMSDEALKLQMYDVIRTIVVFASKEIEIHWKLNNCFESVRDFL